MLIKYKFRLIYVLFYLVVELPVHAQVTTKVTLSVVVSQETNSLSIPQSVVLLELQNLTDQPQIILHQRPWRDYVTRAITLDKSAGSSISQNNSKTPTSEKKYSVRQSYSIIYHPLYTSLIEKHLGNQQTLVELKISKLNDQGVFFADDQKNDRVYGTLLKPGQTYRDLKRIPKQAGRYVYSFAPPLVWTKRVANVIYVSGQAYRLSVPREIESNELTLLVADP